MQGILIQKNITSSLTSPVLEDTIKMSLKLWFLMECYVICTSVHLSTLFNRNIDCKFIHHSNIMIFINVENILSLNSSSFKICSFSHNSLSLYTLSSQCWSSSSWPRLTERWPWRDPWAGVADTRRSLRCLSTHPSHQSSLWSERTGSPRMLRAFLSQSPWSWLCPESWWWYHVIPGHLMMRVAQSYLTISWAQPESTMKSMTQGMTPSTLDRTSNININSRNYILSWQTDQAAPATCL